MRNITKRLILFKLYYFSTNSTGLFQRIITESGNALAPWTINDDPEKCAFDVGLKLGFTGNNPKELFEFLKKQSVNDLVMAAKVVSSDFKNVNSYFIFHEFVH